MELSKNDTKMLQALFVMAMLCLHLFCTYDYSDKYTPLLYIGGVPICFYIAQLSDFCVFGFAFCSGYGHMAQYGREYFYKNRLKGLLSVLCSYWIILIVFSAVSIVAGQGSNMPGSATEFILNALILESSYNGAWWYMFAYAILVIMSPWLLKIVKKHKTGIVMGVGFIIYCVAYYVRFKLGYGTWLLGKFGPFGMTLFEYLIGAECYKMKLFTKLYNLWSKMHVILQWMFSLILIICMLYGHTKIVTSLFIAPVTGFVVMVLFHFWNKPQIIQKFFLFIGEHSTNIWLTHMFFYLVLFEGLAYKAKYPPLIYVFLLVVTVVVSMGLKLIEKPIQNVVRKI